jgi:hypothetical protein
MAEQQAAAPPFYYAADVWRVCGFNTSFAPLMMSKMRYGCRPLLGAKGRSPKAFSRLIAMNFYGRPASLLWNLRGRSLPL